MEGTTTTTIIIIIIIADTNGPLTGAIFVVLQFFRLSIAIIIMPEVTPTQVRR